MIKVTADQQIKTSIALTNHDKYEISQAVIKFDKKPAMKTVRISTANCFMKFENSH